MGYTEQGLPFAEGSQTSFKAARAAAWTRQTKTARYLRMLNSCGPKTDHEAATALTLPLSSICSIRNNVVDAGLVQRGDQERKSPWGRDCSTWSLTRAGVRAVDAMKEIR